MMKPIPLRLAPVLVAAAIPLLGFKLVDIAVALAGHAVQSAEASAAPQAPVAPASAAPAPAASPAAPAAVSSASPASLSPASSSPASPGRAPTAAPPAPSKAAAVAGGGSDPTSFSPAEINLLQELSQRRAELDKRAAELDGREMMLKATEQRIAEKIAELQKMQNNINALLKKKDKENDTKIKSLVKIYEIMKPQDAARIFEQLDMPVLLEVVEHMNERKAAPILANMQPQKAKALTLALAEHRQTSKP
jgi:flagellar motility protein MotE (MotC chaperone)